MTEEAPRKGTVSARQQGICSAPELARGVVCDSEMSRRLFAAYVTVVGRKWHRYC